MNRILLFAMACIGCIGIADAAVRDASTIARNTISPQTVGIRAVTTSTPTVSTRTATASPRTATITPSAGRTATRTKITGTIPRTSARATATTTVARNATTVTRAATNARAAVTTASKNVAQTSARAGRSAIIPTIARASTTPSTQTFDTGYNACRDAYFTCMDQFCATASDTYRRCVCSSKLNDIKSREKTLAQTAEELQDFKDLNLDIITKSAAEVNAMLTATAGESIAASAKDTSDSAKQLAGISDVLSSTKNKSLSTQGTLDIAGDINAIWATSTLTSAANIANLTGEALYSAVHSQCVELVADSCESSATLNMVISAYGMYIENDCNLLISALDKKTAAASGDIRETEHAMNQARLENYNNHNSTTINDCIAQVRQDITSETACGANYVHCLDVTGKYLNYTTGEPIYSDDFYQLANQISLSGDILTNNTNQLIVAELTRKRQYAARGLDTCRDLADEVWPEFMRQAITEIYQGQQERIRRVKSECLDVVSTCYDEQSAQLKDFTNTDEQLLLGSRLELAEQMCETKMNTCSNLYGNGSNGMQALLDAMHGITDQKIAKQCLATLQDYVKDICTPPSSDTLHAYPYACRVYAPSNQKYATYSVCNTKLTTDTEQQSTASVYQYQCSTSNDEPVIEYTSCKAGYYLNGTGAGNECASCPANCTCSGGTSQPICPVDCSDYPGSLYQKLVRYAMQACMRESDAANNVPSSTVLQDVSTVMDSIRVSMAKQLANECERIGGTWANTQWIANEEKHVYTGQTLFAPFYTTTNANTDWGFCATQAYSADTLINVKFNTSVSESCQNELKTLKLQQTDTIQARPFYAAPTDANIKVEYECKFNNTSFDMTIPQLQWRTSDGTLYYYHSGADSTASVPTPTGAAIPNQDIELYPCCRRVNAYDKPIPNTGNLAAKI